MTEGFGPRSTSPAHYAGYPIIPSGARLHGEQLRRFIRDCAEWYEAGEPIRTIQERTGRSYGSVHRALLESGTKMRPQGSRPPAK